MKRIFSILSIVVIVFSISSCAKKFTPSIKIKSDNVTSIEFKKTVFDVTNTYKQKTVTETDDIKTLCQWLTNLSLAKHEPIEIPVEKISYAIILKGTKEHRVVFMDEYIIYDNVAYTFNKNRDLNAVATKYDLLNYNETDATLGLIS